MTGAADFASGKGHRDENFPVASRLVRAELRPTILAFYRFARAADDVADHATAGAEQKLAELDRLEAGLRGEAGASAEGERLRVGPAGERGSRTATRSTCWRPSGATSPSGAMPTGPSSWTTAAIRRRRSAASCSTCMANRRHLWPLNDALCAALQVINHLQDCAKDYRELDRVYVPLDALSAARPGGAKRSPIDKPRRRCAP